MCLIIKFQMSVVRDILINHATCMAPSKSSKCIAKHTPHTVQTNDNNKTCSTICLTVHTYTHATEYNGHVDEAADIHLLLLLLPSRPCLIFSSVSNVKSAVCRSVSTGPQKLLVGNHRTGLCLASQSVKGGAGLQDVVGGSRICVAWTFV